MDNYTRKFFFEEVEQILNNQPVEKSQPVLVYYAKDDLPELLHFSGNKAVGNLIGLLEAIFGYIGESSFAKKAFRDDLLEKLEEITRDPEILRKAEEFHKKVSSLTIEELLRRFTI